MGGWWARARCSLRALTLPPPHPPPPPLQLAKVWHPDKHQGGDLDAVVAKFQEIQRAYESLMSTDEDARVEALGHK